MSTFGGGWTLSCGRAAVVRGPMIDITTTGRLAVASLRGEFDISNADDIRTSVAGLLSRGYSDVTVDVSATTFLDVTAINALVAANALVEETGGRMVLVGLSPFMLRLLALIGLGPLLPAFAPARWERRHDERRGVVPTPAADLAEEFRALAEVLALDETLTDNLSRIVTAAAATIPQCTAASAALVVHGRSRTATASNHVAIEVDVAQYVADEGPCLASVRTGQRIRVDVLGADEHFVHFAPRAVEAGIQASLTAPIVLDGQPIGSLNCYSTGGPFGLDAEAMADVLAAQAATFIAHSTAYPAAQRVAALAQGRSDEERDIAIAEGVVSILHTVSVEQAARLLRSEVGGDHGRLVEAARRILAQLEAQPGPASA